MYLIWGYISLEPVGNSKNIISVPQTCAWGVSPLACLVIVNIQHDQILGLIAENRIGPNTDNNASISIISIIIILCLSERNFLTIPEHS